MNKPTGTMTRISRSEVLLDDGSSVRIVDMLSAPKSTPAHEVSNNVFRIAADGTTMWQIDAGEGVGERCPFTGLVIRDNQKVLGFRWDGGIYAIDLETGKAKYVDFGK